MTILFCILGPVFAGLMGLILNKMPAKCFCDYDETPDQRHLAPRAGKKSLIVCALILAVAFPILYARLGLSVTGCALCLLCAALLMIALSDLRFCIIPDELIIACCVLATVSAFPQILAGPTWADRLDPIFGAAVGGGIIYAINLLGRILYKKDALGMGDLKLMIVCGIACGCVGTVIAMLCGILAAGFWFATAMALKKVRSGQYLPLGPFLVFGTMFTLCFRPQVDAFLAWYLSLI